MRKLLIGCVVMAVIATVGVLFAHRQAESEPREDFVAMEHRWLDAQSKGDTKTLGEMYGDEFLGVAYGAELLKKTDTCRSKVSRAPSGPAPRSRTCRREYMATSPSSSI